MYGSSYSSASDHQLLLAQPSCQNQSSFPVACQAPGILARAKVNKPIHFDGGQWAGRTVRVELHEIQKANLGRK